ncbi:hypothetical protein HY008_02680 [Candidatus Woesebacteria bacterium]|nr:hypothetical protein [Candidatus Woesebacteria bacterium]
MAKRRTRRQKEKASVKWQFSGIIEARESENIKTENTNFSENLASVPVIKKDILKSLVLASLILMTEVVLYLIRI